MELFGLYWHIWSRLMILSSENLSEDWKFEKSSDEIVGHHIGVDSKFTIVMQLGMHWSKFVESVFTVLKGNRIEFSCCGDRGHFYFLLKFERDPLLFPGWILKILFLRNAHKGRPIKGISSRVCASKEDLLIFSSRLEANDGGRNPFLGHMASERAWSQSMLLRSSITDNNIIIH